MRQVSDVEKHGTRVLEAAGRQSTLLLQSEDDLGHVKVDAASDVGVLQRSNRFGRIKAARILKTVVLGQLQLPRSGRLYKHRTILQTAKAGKVLHFVCLCSRDQIWHLEASSVVAEH